MPKKYLIILIMCLAALTIMGFATIAFLLSTPSYPDPNHTNAPSPSATATPSTSPISISDAPPILVTFVSHNEEPGRYPNFTTDQAIFEEYRAGLLNFVTMIKEENMTHAYDWQTDYNFAIGIANFDDGSPETQGLNIAQYIASLGIEVDPHTHIKDYNYADVAYLIKELGVTPTNIAGGFIISPVGASQLESLWKTVTGLHYNYSWTAEATWGGGSGGHTNDANASGVWYPKNKTDFLTPSNTPTVANIGPYLGSFEGVLDLLEQQEAGKLEAGKIYTATIMANQLDMQTPGYADAYRSYIERLRPYAEDGRIIFTNLEGVVDLWKNSYKSEPNVYLPSETSNTGSTASPDGRALRSVCGDGVCNNFEQSSGVCSADCE